jgi:hypothetical protein
MPKKDKGLDDLTTFANACVIALGISETGVTEFQAKLLRRMDVRHQYSMVQAFRGSGKSTMASLYILWRLYMNPEEKIIIISAGNDLAKDRVRFLRECISKIPFLQHLQPRADQRNQATNFDVGPAKPSPNPSVLSRGVGSQITGSRATLILVDDAEVSTNINKADTQRALDTLLNEAVHILLPDADPISKVLILGTPHSAASFYNSLEQRGYAVKKFPCWTQYGDAPKRPSCKERFPMTILRERQKQLSKAEFQLQMLLDTDVVDEDIYPLKLQYLKVMKGRPSPVNARESIYRTNNAVDLYVHGTKGSDKLYYGEGVGGWINYQKRIMVIDPATDKGRDDTAVLITGVVNGYLHLLEQFTLTDWSEPNIQKIIDKAEEYDVAEVGIETIGVGALAVNLLSPKLKRTLTPIKNTVKKERRIIDTLSPILENGRIIIYEEMVERDLTKGSNSLLTQMVGMTKLTKCLLKNDDQLDVLAMTVQLLDKEVAVDEIALKRMRQEEAWEKELEKLQGGSVDTGLIYASRSGRGGRRRW